MKIKIVLVIYFLSFSLIYSQKESYKDLLKLKSAEQYTEDWQVKSLVQQIISNYSYAFKYFEELKSGLYKFEKSNAKSSESISLSVYDKDKKNIIDRIQLEKIRINNITSYIIQKDEEKRLVDSYKLAERNHNNFKNSMSTINETNNMLWDKEILGTPELEQDNKILNLKMINS